MAEDPDNKEEKFDFTLEGEAVEYITLEQARVLAIEHARDNTDFYSPRYRQTTLVWEVMGQEEGEDYYEIRLSFRPAGNYPGRPGVEQFIIDKIGTIKVRQLLEEPSRSKLPMLVFTGLAAVVVIAAIVAGAVFALSGNGPPPPPTAIPAGAAISPTATSAPVANTRPASAPLVAPLVAPLSQPTAAPAMVQPVTPTGGSTSQPTAVPTATAVPITVPAPVLVPTSTPTPVSTSTPIPNAPSLSIAPAEVVPNQTLAIIGRGFTPGSQGQVQRITIAGRRVQANKANGGSVLRIDVNGNWSGSLVIPINNVTTTPGTHELTVIDNQGLRATTDLVILPRTLVLDPDQSRWGSTIEVNGTGYPADNTKSGAVSVPSVAINYTVFGRPQLVATLTPDPSGNISGSFTVPIGAPIPSIATVTAEYKFGTTLFSTSAAHAVPAPSLKLDVTAGPAGTQVLLEGIGFRRFSRLRTLKFGEVDVSPYPAPSTDADGAFSAMVTVPGNAPGFAELSVAFGARRGTLVYFSGTDRQVSVSISETTAEAGFRVTSSPSLPDYPLPTAKAAIRVSPTEGSAGSLVTISGTGFPGFTPLNQFEIGDINVRSAPVPTTDALGSFRAQFIVPKLDRGPTVISSRVGATTASKFFTVN